MSLSASKLCDAGPRPSYGIITDEILSQIFTRRLMAADLLSHTDELRSHHAGFMVRETLLTIKKELEELIL